MKAVLDACVIFPTVMREMLIGAAQAGLFIPVWSDRILEEWTRATKRLGEGAEDIARGEAALMRAQFPQACVTGSEDGLWLPDGDDIHVLASAIASDADAIITRNISDFPTRSLGQHGILRRDPDGFLLEYFHAQPTIVEKVAQDMRARAEAASGREQELRGLLKRAGMPRLGKALAGK